MRCCVVLLLVVLLEACSGQYAGHGEAVYLQSRNGPQLIVPAPLQQDEISDFYILPRLTQDPRLQLAPPGA